MQLEAVFKTVDTCAAEFAAATPYYYSTYEEENEAQPSRRRKVIILGGGPNRIGQGIEFDYCCVHGVFALKEEGFEVQMINCNPETVSTDYDITDRLFFEPLTFEDVMRIIDNEKPYGVIVQFGGQTPLKLAIPLERAGVRILGTSPDSIDLAEDRKRFGALLRRLRIPHPPYGTAGSAAEALAVARQIGYPVLVRPSYVLGGRAMKIVYDDHMLRQYMRDAVSASSEHPVLIDKFVEDAFEFDVDAVYDGHDLLLGGIMQHIEEAGIHSGDSACVLPPYLITPRAAGANRAVYASTGARIEGQRSAQRAVRHARRRRLRAGGQSARFTHRAVCQQGHRPAAGQSGGPGDGRPVAETDGPHPAAATAAHFGQGSGVAVQQIQRRKHLSGTGNALHRRSDGHFLQLRQCLRQVAAGCRRRTAYRRHGVHQCQ